MDRLHGSELGMTEELIANMCGVQREGETEGALELQEAGLIEYARPHRGTRPPALEKRMCECCAVVKEQYDRRAPDLLAT